MQFGILGPLEVLDRGEALPLGGAKQRALLAVLLLHPNEAVSVDRLIEDVWGEEPPGSAANALQVYVSGLRKVLEPGRGTGAATVLVTRAPGYVLRVEPDELDAHRFERLAAEGRSALGEGRFEQAAAVFREALALWRGPPLADAAFESFAVHETLRLDELRQSTTEDLVEARLGLGEHAELAGELGARVAEQPLRERLCAQLMLALYRSGRQAEALEVYRSTRRTFRDELGIEPSRALQQLEQAILRQEAALDLALPAREELAAAPPARKPVTAVVVSLELGEALDPEAEHDALGPLVAAASDVLGRHGATVEATAEGAVVGLFGVPAVREDDALRAARAALDLRAALTPSPAELRIGIASSLAVVTGTRVAGGVVREATRLGQRGRPGDVILGPAARDLLGGGVEVERSPAGEWLLLGVDSEAAPIPRRLDAPIVGRTAELGRLLGLFADAVDAPGVRIVTLLGSPGIGKSRLAKEAADRCADRADVLQAQCWSAGEGVTFQPLAELVVRLAGADVRAGLEALLADAEGAAIAERIAGAIGAIDRETPIEETSWAVRRLFERLAAQRPLVVVLEDLHWAEPGFLELIEHLAASTAAVPILLVCVSRPELGDERPAWPGPRIALHPLDETATDALLDQILPDEGVDPGLRARIADTAEGNPLFIEQMAALLGEPGAAGGEIAVPASIQALLAARLDLLPPGERQVVEPASIAGREFSLAGLAALAPGLNGAAVLAALERLDGKHFVSRAGYGRYRFSHQLIRDAAYDAIPKRSRAALHLRYADWLEDGRGVSAAELDELAGYHLERAYELTAELDPHAESLDEVGRRAAIHLRTAGARAHTRAGAPAAVGFLARAGALPAGSDAERAELLLELAGAQREIGDYQAADADAQETIALATRLGDRPLVARASAVRLRIQLQTNSAASTDEALAGAERTIEELAALGEEQGLGQTWWAVAWIAWVRCQAGATERTLARALEYARKAGDEATLVDCQNLTVGTWLFGPTPAPEAIAHCEELAELPGTHPRIRACAYRALGGLNAMLGRFDEARSMLEQDRAIIDEYRLQIALSVAAEVWGIVELTAGNPAAAETWLREGIAALEPTGETSGLSTLTAMLAEAVYLQDRPAEALTHSDRALLLAMDDDITTHVQLRSPRARVLAGRGQVDEAEALAREAVALAAPTDFLNLRGQALVTLAEVLRAGGRADDARAAADEALALFERKGNLAEAGRVQRLLAAPTAIS